MFDNDARIFVASKDLDQIIPRWEWRTFSASLAALERATGPLADVAPRNSSEIYILSLHGPQNAKLRGGLIDIKRLQQVDDDGLELWEPVLKVKFPLGRYDIAVAFSEWHLPLGFGSTRISIAICAVTIAVSVLAKSATTSARPRAGAADRKRGGSARSRRDFRDRRRAVPARGHWRHPENLRRDCPDDRTEQWDAPCRAAPGNSARIAARSPDIANQPLKTMKTIACVIDFLSRISYSAPLPRLGKLLNTRLNFEHRPLML